MSEPNSGCCVKLGVGRRLFLEALLSGFSFGAALLRFCGSLLPGSGLWGRAIHQPVPLAVDGLEHSVGENEPGSPVRVYDLEEHQEAGCFGAPCLHHVGHVLLKDGDGINDGGWSRYLDPRQSFKARPYAVELGFMARFRIDHRKSLSAPAIQLLKCLAANLVGSATYILSWGLKALVPLSAKSLFQIQKHALRTVKSPRYLPKTNFSYFPYLGVRPLCAPGGEP